MSALTEFLLARIAEDEASAREAAVMRYQSRMGEEYDWTAAILSIERDATEAQDDFVAQWRPSRVLADCKAKRRIVGHPAVHPHTLWALATVYADHSDYREEWRP